MKMIVGGRETRGILQSALALNGRMERLGKDDAYSRNALSNSKCALPPA